MSRIPMPENFLTSHDVLSGRGDTSPAEDAWDATLASLILDETRILAFKGGREVLRSVYAEGIDYADRESLVTQGQFDAEVNNRFPLPRKTVLDDSNVLNHWHVWYDRREKNPWCASHTDSRDHIVRMSSLVEIIVYVCPNCKENYDALHSQLLILKINPTTEVDASDPRPAVEL